MDTLNKVEVRLISIRALIQTMDRADLNATELADLTQRLYRGKRSKIRPIRRQVISHLRNGTRSTVSPNTADAIEGALGQIPGALFVTKVLPVSQNKGRAA